MSTVAISPIHRAVRFYEAPIGKKAVMAVTGLVLFGYVVAHLLGAKSQGIGRVILPTANEREAAVERVIVPF